jgi:hypothetical protein
MKAEIISWVEVENDSTQGREILAGIVEGSRFGAIVSIEKVEKGFLLIIERGDRSRRTISILETLEGAQAAASHLIAIK